MQKILDVDNSVALIIVSSLKFISTNEGKIELNQIHHRTLEAVARELFKIEPSIDELEASFDAIGEIEDPEVREGVIHLASVLPFLEDGKQRERTETLHKLVELWGLPSGVPEAAMSLAKGHKFKLMLHQMQSQQSEVGLSMMHQAFGTLLGVLHMDGNNSVLERYKGYRDLPDGTLGRTLVEYYEQNEFSMPGTAGSPFANVLIKHDIHHVLSGYDTSPLGETCVIAFDQGISREDLSASLVTVMAQFQLGIVMDATVNAWRGQFDPTAVFRAFRRGGECSVNYIDDDFDFVSLMSEPLINIRQRFKIPDEGMFVRSAEDLWCSTLGPMSQRNSDQLVKPASWHPGSN